MWTELKRINPLYGHEKERQGNRQRRGTQSPKNGKPRGEMQKEAEREDAFWGDVDFRG